MTNEKRLETVLRAIRASWNDVDGLTVDEALKNPAQWIQFNPLHAGNRALLELYADALESLEKQKTGTGTLSVLKRIVKDGADRFNGASEWNGLYYLCSAPLFPKSSTNTKRTERSTNRTKRNRTKPTKRQHKALPA